MRGESGVVGILGIVVYTSIILLIGAVMVSSAVINYHASNKRINSTQTVYNAESGAEDMLLHVKRDNNYGSASTTLTTPLPNNNSVEAVISTIVSPPCNPSKQITSSGSQSGLVRRIQLNNCALPDLPNITFGYALQAGAGGITMDNNSSVVGTTYSNGSHTGSPGATVTQDVWVAGAPSGTATPQYDPAAPTGLQFGNSANPNLIDVAQSFTADTTTSDKLIKVSLKVRKIGNPSNATVRIVTDNSNKPSSTQVAGGVLNTALVGSTLSFIDVSMTTPPTLSNGNRYWIVIDADANASNYWEWASQDGFAGGKGMSSDRWRTGGSMTWNDTGADFAFKAFMGGSPTFARDLTIGRDVHANTITNNTVARDGYFQTNNGSTIAGSQFPGSADPATREPPVSDANVTDFKNNAATGVLHSGDYVIPGNETRTIGPMKITGKLTVENGATLKLSGTVWVEGEITIKNNSHITLDQAAYPCGTSGALIGDFKIVIENNVDAADLNLGCVPPTKHIMILTTYAATDAMTISNNAAGVVFVALHGTLLIQNNAGVNAAYADRIHLKNNAAITYLEGLADVRFSGGSGGGYTARGWNEKVCDSGLVSCQNP